MIDVESAIFTEVKNAVLAKYPDMQIDSEYVESPESFPCVSFVEADNYIHASTRSLSKIENHADVMYECNIYTNKAGVKKSQAKAIADIIDNAMCRLGFTRTLRNQIPNINRTIYRIVMRWTGVVSAGVIDDNGNTVHQIYSK